MKDTVTIRHRDNMSFDVKVSGHSLVVDTAQEFGGKNEGPRPKSLMLVALAGCTGIDLVSLLKKMRINFDDLQIRVDGNVTQEHPKHFDHMHITYILKGKNIPREKVNKAIELSQEKYCGVSYTYRASVKISYDLIIEK